MIFELYLLVNLYEYHNFLVFLALALLLTTVTKVGKNALVAFPFSFFL